MTRLTRTSRATIHQILMERAYKDRANHSVFKFAELSMRAYKAALGPANLRKLDALPHDWFYRDEGVKVQFAATPVNLYFSGCVNTSYLPLEFDRVGASKIEDVRLKMPAKMRQGVCAVFEAGHPLTEEYNKLAEERSELLTEINRVSAQTLSVLERASTVKQLKEVWPEVGPMLDQIAPEEQLPALPLGQLNKALDLPPRSQP